MAKRKNANSRDPSTSETRELEREAKQIESEEEEGKEEFERENP